MKNGKDSRGLRAGGYSIALSLIAIAVVIVLNLLVGALPKSITQPENTSKKLYDFDERTEEIAKAVDEPVTIYVWAEKLNCDQLVDQFLQRYAELNSRITVKYVDPALDPTFLQTYDLDAEEVAANSFIVESNKRFRLVSYEELYTYSYSEDQLYYYYMQYGQLPATDQFSAESAVSSAVDYVTTDVLPTIYLLGGHGEAGLGATLIAAVDEENMAIEDLSLLTEPAVPSDCDLLIIAAPKQDLTPEETAKIRTYLENGGDVLLFTNYTNAAPANLAELCAAYGLKAEEGVIFEDSSHSYGYPYMLVSEMASHAITDPLIAAKSPVILPITHGISTLDAYRSTLTIEPLLATGKGAYLKDAENMTTAEQEEGDKSGPFYTAVIASETVNGKTGRFLWVATDSLFTDSVISYYGNMDLVMNIFGFTCDKQSAITVRPVSLAVEQLFISDGSARLWSVVFTIVIPVAIALAGLFVWLKRRKR